MFLQNELLTRLLDELVADDSSGGFRDCRSYLGEAVRMHLPDRRNQVIRTACPNCSVGLLFARCQLSPNVLATYTRFAWLTGAVLARLTISLLALPFGVGQAYRIESIRFQLLCRWASLSLFSCCCTAQKNDHHCS